MTRTLDDFSLIKGWRAANKFAEHILNKNRKYLKGIGDAAG